MASAAQPHMQLQQIEVPAVPSLHLPRAVKDIIAGFCGGVSVCAVGHPLDTLKVRLQMQPTSPPLYNGLLDAARKTWSWEGISGFYAGVKSPLVGQVFLRGTMVGTFGAAKRYLGRNADGTARPLTPVEGYQAGAITGAAVACVAAPQDFLKIQTQTQILRLQADPNYQAPFTTVSGCLRAAVRTNGLVRGPLQGLSTAFLRDIPAFATYLGTNELVQREVAQRLYDGCNPAELPLPAVAGCAAVGALAYWLPVYPLDVIKSARLSDDMDLGKRRYPTIAAAAKKLWAEGGARRFYRGLTPALARAVPANTALLITVGQVQALLGNN